MFWFKNFCKSINGFSFIKIIESDSRIYFEKMNRILELYEKMCKNKNFKFQNGYIVWSLSYNTLQTYHYYAKSFALTLY